MILVLRTDKPVSEMGLFNDGKELAYETWQAHRQLAETIHQKMKSLLDAQDSSLSDVKGIVVYKGPGSFTGLRIGVSVANALAYSLNIPITGTSGDGWQYEGLAALQAGHNDVVVVPDYGGSVNVTKPKK